MNEHATDHQRAVEDAQRRGHMAALSVAEQIVSTSPLPPTDVRTSCPTFAAGEPSVDVYFHQCAAGVEMLAKELGGTAITRPHSELDPRPYVSAQLAVSGIPVRAWSLLGNRDDAAGEAR